MKSIILICSLLINFVIQAQPVSAPDQIYGELFRDVQLAKIFPDGKTFVDATPKRNPKEIVSDYLHQKNNASAKFSLLKFVEENFIIPKSVSADVVKTTDLSTHIHQLWSVLKREKDEKVEASSLLPLPFSYIVPGGRFREIYYWDSYFTMLGLKESKEYDLIENMINNFAYLINQYGHIPNGNRTYYLSRSQPPFFALMIDLLAEIKGNQIYVFYLSAMQKEYDYWMDKTASTHHVVKMQDGSILNRYYDIEEKPRQESYAEDVELAKIAKHVSNKWIWKNLRAGAESGWDFSSRWFADGKSIATIETINIIPVDLNCLLYQLELNIAKAYKEKGAMLEANVFEQKAIARKKAILKYCWDNQKKWFADYHLIKKKTTTSISLAGMMPLMMNIASQQQADDVAKNLEANFLKAGGVVSTLVNTHQQWDAPNGWAPLQWITIVGLANYHHNKLATVIANRWMKLNEDVFERTGKLMEKYNVIDTNLEAGGGEYPGQDGFGWTNGVYLALKAMFKKN